MIEKSNKFNLEYFAGAYEVTSVSAIYEASSRIKQSWVY